MTIAKSLAVIGLGLAWVGGCSAQEPARSETSNTLSIECEWSGKARTGFQDITEAVCRTAREEVEAAGAEISEPLFDALSSKFRIEVSMPTEIILVANLLERDQAGHYAPVNTLQATTSDAPTGLRTAGVLGQAVGLEVISVIQQSNLPEP